MQDTLASQPVGIQAVGGDTNGTLDLDFGGKPSTHHMPIIDQNTGNPTTVEVFDNQIISSHNDKAKTVEEYLELAAQHGLQVLHDENFLINSGEDGTHYFQRDVLMDFEDKKEPLKIISKGQLIIIPRILMTVGIKIHQFRFTHDRSSNLLYALAVQDCIADTTYAIYKKDGEDVTKWVELTNKETSEDSLQNGSLMKVTTKGFFEPKEMDHLKFKEQETE